MEQTSPGLGSSHILLNLGESNEKFVLHTQISPLLNHQYPLPACMKGDTRHLPTHLQSPNAESVLLKTSTNNLLIISLIFCAAK